MNFPAALADGAGLETELTGRSGSGAPSDVLLEMTPIESFPSMFSGSEHARTWPGDRAEPGAARDSSGVHQPECDKCRAECDEHVRHIAAPSQGQPAADGRNKKPRHVRDQWPEEPPGPHRGEVERQAESEETVERTDQAQIARAGIEHCWVRIEQREPRVREGGGTDADDLREADSDPGADPGRAQRAASLARSDIRSHHGDERPPEPEHERDQPVLQARPGSVARDRSGPEAAA